MTYESLVFISTIYSIVSLIGALSILLVIIPKIVQEGNVRNGLIKFRRLLLAAGTSIFLLTLVALIVIMGRLFSTFILYRYLSSFLIMIFSTIVLIVAIAKYKIYTFNFSDSQKEYHRKKEKKES